MQKLTYALFIFLLFSCGNDEAETELSLIGTWVLGSVSGTCSGISVEGQADETGCIDIPTLEVNCSIIEITGQGALQYAYDLDIQDGSYTIDGEEITICTDRCLTYTLEVSRLTLQTGTLSICDPIYTFSKSSSNLEELSISNKRKFIDKVTKNGVLHRSYTYNPDGSLQAVQTYQDNGDLRYVDTYTYSAATTSGIRNYPATGSSITYLYYNEAPNRIRRDKTQNGELSSYRLYFTDANGCWVDRVEEYSDDALEQLYQYDYTGENCNYEMKYFEQGALRRTVNVQRDGKRYWASSALLNILQQNGISNTTSYSVFSDGAVVSEVSYTSAYTYDQSDFPLSEVRTFLDGDVDVYIYNYTE